ncbi:MAG: AMP-binding protein, partial [Methyloligellaceae bacterium]
MNLSITLQNVARCLPERPAITSDLGVLSYGAFEDRAARIAGGLCDRHALAPGARVAIAMENCPEYLEVLYGVWRAGLTAVPINARLHPKELAFIMVNSEARLAVTSPKIADAFGGTGDGEGAAPAIVVAGSDDYRRLLAGDPVSDVPGGPEDEAWLFYTSGTTGRPKGAVLTHRNLLFMTHAYYADADWVGPADVRLHAAPLSHGSGLYALAHVAKGANNVILAGAADPDGIYDALERYDDVAMFAAPTTVSRLLQSPRAGSSDTSGLKTLCFGGGPMYVADLKQALELFGPKMYQLYGQGESPMTITSVPKAMYADRAHSHYEALLQSVGVPRTGVAVKVVDERGRELPRGEVGEIITRSDCVMREYWANPEATAASLRDGWLWTGDMGAMSEDGLLTLKDRSKDMIISGGSNIYPREVEEVLLTHPDIVETAVVGRAHADWGEEVVAFVVPRPGAELGEPALDQLCLENIARFKRPRGYR